jgi:hypothetical protein
MAMTLAANTVAQMATLLLIDDYRKTDRPPTHVTESARKAYVQVAWAILNEAQRQESTVGRAVSHVDDTTAEEDLARLRALSAEAAKPRSDGTLVWESELSDALRDAEWHRAARAIVRLVEHTAPAMALKRAVDESIPRAADVLPEKPPRIAVEAMFSSEPATPAKDVQVTFTNEPEQFAFRLEDIVDLIYFKRRAQDKQWGGAEHDDKLRSDEWLKIRDKFEQRICLARRQNNVPAAYDALVDVIALGVAQMQSLLRQYPYVVSDVAR